MANKMGWVIALEHESHDVYTTVRHIYGADKVALEAEARAIMNADDGWINTFAEAQECGLVSCDLTKMCWLAILTSSQLGFGV